MNDGEPEEVRVFWVPELVENPVDLTEHLATQEPLTAPAEAFAFSGETADYLDMDQYLPEAVWSNAVDPEAPPPTRDVEAYADWLERHCTQPDGSPVVLHRWQREVLASFMTPRPDGPVTPRRARRSSRPACLWRPSGPPH